MVIAINHKRIVGYTRVSTDRQAGEGRFSLETQESRIRAAAEAAGGLLLKVFCDVESGRRDNRPQYQEMLKYVLAEGVDLVLVQYIDRFGRNPREILTRIWALERHDVAVQATDQDVREEMMLLVSAGMAGHESKRISERVRSNMDNSVKSGVHSGRAPYGFNPVREIRDGKAVVDHWEIDEDEAQIIREMARLSVEDNLGFKAIADTLNERGMKRLGKHWIPATIQQILRNPVNKGLMVYGRRRQQKDPDAELIEVPGVFPQIFSDEEWDRLQTRLDIRRSASRGQTHRSDYILSGIAKCGHCGGPMTGKTGGTYKGKPYRSYVCASAKKAKESCAYSNSHSAKRLEPAVLESLSQFSDPDKVRELLGESGKKELDRKQSELARLEKRLGRLDSDFHKNLDLLKKSVLNEEEFSNANAARRDERAQTEMKLAELREQIAKAQAAQESSEFLPERIASFMEAFEELEPPKAKAMLQMILKAAYVWTDNRIELEFR